MTAKAYYETPEFHEFVENSFGELAKNFRHPYKSIVYEDIEDMLYHYGGAYYLWSRDYMSRVVEEERALRALTGRVFRPAGPIVYGPENRRFLPVREVGEIVVSNEADMEVDKLYHHAFQVEKLPEDYMPPVAFGKEEILLEAAQHPNTQVGKLLEGLAKKDASFSYSIQYDLETGAVLAEYAL